MSKNSEKLDKEFMEKKAKLKPMIDQVKVLDLTLFERDWIELQLVRAYSLGVEDTLRSWLESEKR